MTASLSLLGQLEEAQQSQARDLDEVGERLSRLILDGNAAPLPIHTLDAVVACLRDAFRAHRTTSGHLSTGLARLAEEHDEPRTRMTPGLARLLRELRAGHENLLGLLEFADRLTASFTCPPHATEQQRRLYAALAVWSRRERTCIRLEAEYLVSRALQLAPALASDAHAVTLTVHRREILAQGGRRLDATVFCPAERTSVGVDWCRGCPLLVRMKHDAVRCTPHDERTDHNREAVRIGDDILVGEAMGGHHVSALAETPAADVARALANEPGRPALVVDDGDRLLGMVDGEVAATSTDGQRAGGLSRAAPSIRESASLTDAVDCMVRRHARFLPVVRDDDRVVGVLSDVDALRLIARQRQGG